MPRSVLPKWSYALDGWLNYIFNDDNVGVEGVKLIKSTGALHKAAKQLSRDGFTKLKERHLDAQVASGYFP